MRGLATDSTGNLYVMCSCVDPSGTGTDFEILEFGAGASGNVAPIRTVAPTGITPDTADGALAVDGFGTIFANIVWKGAVVIFPFTTSFTTGAAPSGMITLPAEATSPLSIAIH